MTDSSKHVLSFIVENKPGVLQRVVGLVSRRNFNIHSLAVGPTDDPAYSRMTAVVIADTVSLEQIRKQLEKLISVVKVTEITDQVDPDTVITY